MAVIVQAIAYLKTKQSTVDIERLTFLYVSSILGIGENTLCEPHVEHRHICGYHYHLS